MSYAQLAQFRRYPAQVPSGNSLPLSWSLALDAFAFCSKKKEACCLLLFAKLLSWSLALNGSSALLVLLVASRHQPPPSARSRYALLAPAFLVARVRRIRILLKKKRLPPLSFSQTSLCFARSRFLDDFFFNVSGNLFVFLKFH